MTEQESDGKQVQTPDHGYEKKRNDELHLLYTSCVSEIASFKQQQWHVTNYGLLLYAVIASMPKVVATKLTELELFLLCIGAFSVLASGWFLVGMLSSSIQERRGRQTEVRKLFTEEFRQAWRVGRSKGEVHDSPEEKPSLLWFFRTVFVVGFGVTSWLLARFACVA